ncbi:MAG: hypothetical protein SEPTF4163_005036 [Sporothrix epigloea]
MAQPALMSRSSALSQQLHEKEVLFDNWGLDDDSQVLFNDSSGNPAGQNASDLAPIERKHRRRSKAFVKAAQAVQAAQVEADKKTAEEQSAVEKLESDEITTDDSKDSAELIDLTELQSPPRPRPRPCPPRRTVSTILEPATIFASAVAPLRRTKSTPLPETKNVRGRKRTSDAIDCQAKNAKIRAIEKRRDVTPPLVPERQRIFAGLAFYYLPDSALGARRLRIAKARQHGAQWVRRLRDATHVVVDKQLAWSDIAAVVRDKGGDETRPILVNDEYPLDCIGFRYASKLDLGALRPLPSTWSGQGRAEDDPADGDGNTLANFRPQQAFKPVSLRHCRQAYSQIKMALIGLDITQMLYEVNARSQVDGSPELNGKAFQSRAALPQPSHDFW